MKMILAAAVLAALMASPLFAQSRSTEGAPHPGSYLEQKRPLRADYRGLDGSAWAPNRPTSNPDPIKQGRAVQPPVSVPITMAVMVVEANSSVARRERARNRFKPVRSRSEPATKTRTERADQPPL